MEALIEKWSREQEISLNRRIIIFFWKHGGVTSKRHQMTNVYVQNLLDAMGNAMYSIFIQLYETIMVSAI